MLLLSVVGHFFLESFISERRKIKNLTRFSDASRLGAYWVYIPHLSRRPETEQANGGDMWSADTSPLLFAYS